MLDCFADLIPENVTYYLTQGVFYFKRRSHDLFLKVKLSSSCYVETFNTVTLYFYVFKLHVIKK